MKVKDFKTVLAECDDECEVTFDGDIDGEVVEVKFSHDDTTKYCHIMLTKRQQMVVEIQCILRYKVIATSKADAENQAEELNLPGSYKEGSYELIRVEDKNGDEI